MVNQIKLGETLKKRVKNEKKTKGVQSEIEGPTAVKSWVFSMTMLMLMGSIPGRTRNVL